MYFGQPDKCNSKCSDRCHPLTAMSSHDSDGNKLSSNTKPHVESDPRAPRPAVFATRASEVYDAFRSRPQEEATRHSQSFTRNVLQTARQVETTVQR